MDYKLINYIDTEKINFDIYLYKSGNGNDFLRDIDSLDKEYVLLNPYFKKSKPEIIFVGTDLSSEYLIDLQKYLNNL